MNSVVNGCVFGSEVAEDEKRKELLDRNRIRRAELGQGSKNHLRKRVCVVVRMPTALSLSAAGHTHLCEEVWAQNLR